ncbi:MAG: heme-binding protein [gamma proteobacterium symbiont of Bathyaustriella thionipta]|nr:heme-binding protein [gamma proteobacterium symbiont of Bathyaustriella thionipta]
MKPAGIFTIIISFALFSIGQAAHSADIVSEKSIGMELARDIASEAVLACRKNGYSVSAVVVDRFGLLRAALRDDSAARFTLEIAERKANMTVMAWTDSGQFKAARPDIRQELNHINGLIVMDGGIRIMSGGYNLGAVGVSGAPGGDKDAACARKALEILNERAALLLSTGYFIRIITNA